MTLFLNAVFEPRHPEKARAARRLEGRTTPMKFALIPDY
jgi:hypothetical protein